MRYVGGCEIIRHTPKIPKVTTSLLSLWFSCFSWVDLDLLQNDFNVRNSLVVEVSIRRRVLDITRSRWKVGWKIKQTRISYYTD